ncbi:MAG: AzlC family ABC transporter permease [Trueperaceae bacterium]|nr:AzlC family ABC transporter permease [Trueperaceae bacterium]
MTFSRPAFKEGVKDVAPMMLGVAPFGMITGVSAAAIGMGTPDAVGMSALVFAGASQLAAIALIGQEASFWVIVATTFMINLRMAMYSASLAPWLVHLRPLTRLGLSYLMTDQAYAFSILRYPREPDDFPRRDYYLGVATPLWALWLTATAAGALLGAQVPPAWQLDFAIPLTFLALLAPAVRNVPSLLAALTGGALAVALQGLPFNLGLVLGALSGIAAGTVAEGRVRQRARATSAAGDGDAP